MTRRIVLVNIGSGLTLGGVLPSVALFGDYVARVIARGGTVPYTYTISGGVLPTGLQLDPATGIISGNVTGGSESFTVRATDLTGAFVDRLYSITVIVEPLTLSGHVPDGTVGVPTTYDYTPTGGVPPRTYAVIGAPSGITVPDSALPRLSLNPVSGGIKSWTMRVTDSTSATFDLPDSATFTVVYTQLKIIGAFAAAKVGTTYTSDLPITGGDGHYSNARVTVGALPAWAALSIVGAPGAYFLRCSGTPTGSATTVNFTVAVDSGDGQTATSAQSLVISANAHRYWRVYITANGGGPTNDIEGGSGFRATVGGAYIPVVAASSSSNYVGNSAINAWNNTVGWQSATGAVPVWNAVDLGSDKTIVEVAIKAPAAAYLNRSPTALTIQYSDAGLTGPWTDMKSFSGLTWAPGELKVLSL